MNFLRWREFHCFGAPTCINIIWLVERLAVRVIPVPECFGQIDMRNRFSTPRVFKPEILEICEFVWSNRIFRKFFRLWLSIGRRAAAAPEWNSHQRLIQFHYDCIHTYIYICCLLIWIVACVGTCWGFTYAMMSLLNMCVCVLFFKWVLVMRWFHLLMRGCNVVILFLGWVQVIMVFIMYSFDCAQFWLYCLTW